MENRFFYPKVNEEKCIECGKCITVCPANDRNMSKMEVRDAYAAYTTDDIRLQSSSGGVFYMLAQQIQNEGGYVYGACFDENFTIRHIGGNNREKLRRMQGSKYAQSDIGYAYREMKKGQNEKLTAVNMRDKTIGWSIGSCACQYVFNNLRKVTISGKKDPYMRCFTGDICLRECCYKCNFKGEMNTDLLIGDFWGIDRVCPEMTDEKGVSLVITMSEKGENLFRKTDLKMMKVDADKAIQCNGGFKRIVGHRRYELRNYFMEKCLTTSFDRAYRKTYFWLCGIKALDKIKRKMHIDEKDV